jgi:hypothetical protein
MSGADARKAYFSTAEASAYTGFAISTLEKFRCSGGGPAYLQPKGSRKVMYGRADLDEWMIAGRRASTSEAA